MKRKRKVNSHYTQFAVCTHTSRVVAMTIRIVVVAVVSDFLLLMLRKEFEFRTIQVLCSNFERFEATFDFSERFELKTRSMRVSYERNAHANRMQLPAKLANSNSNYNTTQHNELYTFHFQQLLANLTHTRNECLAKRLSLRHK